MDKLNKFKYDVISIPASVTIDLIYMYILIQNHIVIKK
ncbi:hypothetical protein UMC2_11411 [[Clostridium] sordellii]|nr:hypothetical protein UMC2_11411 [[Clostridium] sordellii] [Paeniclostridium sordellii]